MKKLNQSSLKYYLKQKGAPELTGALNPIYFYESFILGEHKQESSVLKMGSLLDDFVLGTEEDKAKYSEVSFKIPSSNNQIKFTDEIVDWSISMRCPAKSLDDEVWNTAYSNAYKTNRVSIENLRKDFKKYLDWKRDKKTNTKNEKIPITYREAQKRDKQIEAIKANPTANKIIFDTFNSKFTAINQLYLEGKILDMDVCGTLDRVLINDEDKEIILIDLKTCYNSENFTKRAINYGYYIQLPYYKELLQQNYPGYKVIKTLFVCVTTNGEEECFIPNEFQTEDWNKLGKNGGVVHITGEGHKIEESYYLWGYEEIIKNIKWNLDNDIYTHTPKEYNGINDYHAKVIPND